MKPKPENAPHPLPGLRSARQAAGLTQAALAERMGLKVQQIARWEAGDREPLVGAAASLARELGTTVEALLK